jgi:hypothetical protein
MSTIDLTGNVCGRPSRTKDLSRRVAEGLDLRALCIEQIGLFGLRLSDAVGRMRWPDAVVSGW